MDLITTRSMDITRLALDGLMERQKAITANTANATSPDYLRKEVSFESQLKEIIEQDDLKREIKAQNSIQFNPTSIDSLKPEKKYFLQSNLYKNYEPQIVDDTLSGVSSEGNNVELEKEMMDMVKTGTKYSVLATLEQRAVGEISAAIK